MGRRKDQRIREGYQRLNLYRGLLMKRKRIYRPLSFESTGATNDTSANVYHSMLVSKSWNDLTKNQRILYVCMKDRYYGKRKPKSDFPDIEELQNNLCFYFNLELASGVYNLYSRSNHKRFYSDIRALKEHGFIETVSNGKSTHSRSIYKFTSKWQYWHKDVDLKP